MVVNGASAYFRKRDRTGQIHGPPGRNGPRIRTTGPAATVLVSHTKRYLPLVDTFVRTSVSSSRPDQYSRRDGELIHGSRIDHERRPPLPSGVTLVVEVRHWILNPLGRQVADREDSSPKYSWPTRILSRHDRRRGCHL